MTTAPLMPMPFARYFVSCLQLCPAPLREGVGKGARGATLRKLPEPQAGSSTRKAAALATNNPLRESLAHGLVLYD
jgi:hypothetical protein